MRTTALHIVNSLEDIRRLPSNVVRLKGVGLGDSEVLAITRFQSLKEVSLSGCEEVTDRSVVELGRVSSLENLDLSFCNQVTSLSLKALAKLPALRFLNLNWCYAITDSGLVALAGCKSLESISLWSCEELTDSGIEALANLPNLKTLELPEFANITDGALVAISASAARLQSLRLDHLSKISDTGIGSLGALTQLRNLSVNGCAKVTANGIATLQRAIPGIEINSKAALR